MVTPENRSFPERIRQRRAQMLLHSYIYYWLNTFVISDDQWQKWADELTSLQEKYQEPIRYYDEVFKDWDGSTGMHLPTDEWIKVKAKQMLSENKT